MFDKIRLALALNKAAGQYDDISKEIDAMDTKSLFLSKTFWLNVLGLAVTVGNILPQKWAVPVLAIANIGMRLLNITFINRVLLLFG